MTEGTSQPCPACGINVMIGYTKCPKCHVPMPGMATRVKRASMGGGTTSERIEVLDAGSGGGGSGWMWIAVIVVFGAGVALWATQRSSKKSVAVGGPIERGSGVATQAPPPEQPDVLQPPRDPNQPDPAYAADALEGELAGERLYSTVDVFGDLLDVRSAFCGEARLGEILARYAAEMRGAGVSRVRCSETHGAQVFERPL